MAAVIALITEIAGGEVAEVVDTYPTPTSATTVSVTEAQVTALLGNSFGEKEIEESFTKLGFLWKKDATTYTVSVPFWRLDLNLPEDLVEEVGRIVGYDHVPAERLPEAAHAPAVNPRFYAAERARETLLAEGYSEVFTSVFADKGARIVSNKVDGVRPYLRDSLKPGLTEALLKNKPNKELLGLKEIRLFEIGAVWSRDAEVVMVGTITEKVPAFEKPLVPEDAAAYEPLPVPSSVRYQAFSKYPYMVRDVAFWTPAMTDADSVILEVKEVAGELCQKVSLFDRFEKEGRVSLALRLIFQSFERTLEDSEAALAMERVHAFLAEKGFEVR